MSRHGPAVGTAERDPTCDRKRNTTHRCVPRGRRGSVARTSIRRPPSARPRPELGALPQPGFGCSREDCLPQLRMASLKARGDTYLLLSPEEYLRGVGWEAEPPVEPLLDGERRTSRGRPPSCSGGRRSAHRRVAAGIGGVGCTCGLLAALVQSHVVASLPSHASASPRVHAEPVPRDAPSERRATALRAQVRHVRDLRGHEPARARGLHEDRPDPATQAPPVPALARLASSSRPPVPAAGDRPDRSAPEFGFER